MTLRALNPQDILESIDFNHYAKVSEAGFAVTEVPAGPKRWAAIRAFYALIDQDIRNAGAKEWGCDPYAVNWGRIFTPIEFGIWQDIRAFGIVMYPQYPVGKYFVDFGNPVAKLAFECDGRQFHQDADKDAKRQQEIEALGWHVARFPGWRCVTPDELPNDGERFTPNPDRTKPEVERLALAYGLVHGA